MLTYDREAAVDHLRRADPILARVIDSVGPFTLEAQGGSFRSLAQAIFFQQLAGPAARAIMKRVLDLFGTDDARFFTPEEFLAASDKDLRAAGLSRQKLGYLRDLAAKFASGQLREDEFANLDDEEVIHRVTAVKGIGRWTAEMFLIFSLGRPDVLPVDDLGVRRGFQQVYALDGPASPEQMQSIAEPWRPFRSVATWYMWRSLGVALPEQGR